MLLNIGSAKGQLALFIDMHAHANRRGIFFYGNSMNAPDLLQSLLYAKLVSLNTPFFEFSASNFSEANMFAVGKTGEGRDTSSRVTLYKETGLICSYTIEASYMTGNTVNSIASLSNSLIEELEVAQGAQCPKYTQAIFADVGRALLVALLDLKGYNPLSRLQLTHYHTAKGLLAALQRQIQIEVAEKLFKTAFKNYSHAVLAREPLADPLYAVMSSLKPEDVPNVLTIKEGRGLPPMTIRGLLEFLPLEQALQLLAHTPPAFPPRSLLWGMGRRNLPQLATVTMTASAGSGANNNNNNIATGAAVAVAHSQRVAGPVSTGGGGGNTKTTKQPAWVQ